MDCIEAQGLINRFIDDKLDEKALTDFLEHVKHCPSCYDDLEATYTVMAVIRLLDEKEETSDYLKNTLLKFQKQDDIVAATVWRMLK